MDDKKTEKISFWRAAAMNWRGCRLMRSENPGLFPSILLHGIVKAAAPYAGIYLSARIINELAGARRPEVLRPLAAVAVFVTAALALLNAVLLRWETAKKELLWHTGEKIYADKMLDMDFSALDDQHTHDLRSQARQNANWGGWGFSRVVWYFEDLVNGAVAVAGAAALTVSLFTLPVPESAGGLTALNSPLFAAAIVAVLLAVTVLSPLCANKAEGYSVKGADEAKMGNRFFNFFGFVGIDEKKRALDIRIYQQQRLFEAYANKNTAFLPGGVFAKVAKGPGGLMVALSAAVSGAFIGLAYVFVCLKAWAGAFGVGSVTQYIGAITAMSQGAAMLFKTMGSMKNNAAFLKTSYEFLDIPNTMKQGEAGIKAVPGQRYEVEFRDVSFRYPGSDAWSLRHVSLKFKAGSRLAVVGENGSGKTTFIKLLCRLYDPQEGQILINGADIRRYDFNEYRKLFSVAFQDFQLLSQPLGANVAGKAEYDRTRVRRCLEDAGFDRRMERMTKGLDTYLYKEFTEDGVAVSGGEAQKIAIARALYKDAPFIILDEPTAALDPIAEAEIYERFNDIAGDRTAICISHRLSSCKFCDEIAVFDGGRVIQQGSHETLLSDSKGKYARLWQAQAQYYVRC